MPLYFIFYCNRATVFATPAISTIFNVGSVENIVTVIFQTSKVVDALLLNLWKKLL